MGGFGAGAGVLELARKLLIGVALLQAPGVDGRADGDRILRPGWEHRLALAEL